MRVALVLGLMAIVGGCASEPCTNCAKPADMSGPQPPDTPDLGVPAADMTIGTDVAPARPDLAACCDLANPAGPWPLADTTYGAAQGLAGDIIDSSPDDAQNIWASTQDTLYVLTPGATQFRKFTAADGLHIGGFIDPDNHPNTTWMTAIAGGHANEVFVGYYGYESNGDPYKDTDAQKQLGNGDKITLSASGKITVTRYLFHCDFDWGSGCWEDRSPRRMMFVHKGVAAGHLFVGFNHGVAHVFNDEIGDHVHPEIYWQHADGTLEMHLGEQYGLAITPSGDLWVAGRYGVGLQTWNPVPHIQWTSGPFKVAFTTWTGNHSLNVPVGYTEEDSGIAVTPDGTLYVASFTRGLASSTPANYYGTTPVAAAGIPSQILDIAADPDGSLWLVAGSGELLRYVPSTNTVSAWPGIGAARRVVIDTTVTPRAVYVAMNGGIAVIRAK
jgi:hypothetical protein